jgi:hypothetical protein
VKKKQKPIKEGMKKFIKIQKLLINYKKFNFTRNIRIFENEIERESMEYDVVIVGCFKY